MKVNTMRFAMLATAVATISFAGCTWHDGSASYEHHHAVHEQPPVVYQPAPVVYQQEIPTRTVVVQEAPQQPLYVVRNAPPRAPNEQIPPNPGRGAVWTNGYWVAQPNGWYWVSGRWTLPPRANAVWVEPRWEQRGTEYHFSVGVWQ